MRNIFIFSAIMVALCSFSVDSDAKGDRLAPDTSRLGLEVYKWHLSAIHADGKTVPVTGKSAFIRFNIGKGSAGGNGACNSFGASVTLEGTKIGFSNIFSTKMYCESTQLIENSFFEQLRKVNRYAISDEKLILYDGENLLLEFEGVAANANSR